ncbi:MAG: ammonium transporter [Desulfobaccales bacterium]
MVDRKRVFIFGIIALLIALATVPLVLWAAEPAAPTAAPAVTADPGGTVTGNVKDITAKEAGKPLLAEIAEAVGHNKISINIIWTLITGYLVMFMQLGFALVETGFTRAKNAVHTMGMNIMIYCIGMLGFWLAGFAFMFGGVGQVANLGMVANLNNELTVNLFGKDWGFLGYKGFFLSGDAYDVSVMTLFLFQMVFMDTAATIPTGAMAERWKFLAFAVYGLFISILIYPIYGNWVWGGGWLSQLGSNLGLGHGAVDFAGSGVVHMVGGVTSLAGIIVLGPRIGKFMKDGTPKAIPGHHIPMGVAGALILAFGWFGFNPGSTLAGTDLRIGVIAVNTMLASGAGGLVAMIVMWLKFGKPDLTMSANGLLAGLVAITAPCAFVHPVAAVAIGAIAGALVIFSVLFIESVLKLDDPVGAVSVHGTCGAWGVLSLGLFADGTYGDKWNSVEGTVKGLFYGDASQFLAQVIDVAVNFVFVFCLAWVVFKIIDAVIGMRVSKETEMAGLDVPEMGAMAYPDFVQSRGMRKETANGES